MGLPGQIASAKTGVVPTYVGCALHVLDGRWGMRQVCVTLVRHAEPASAGATAAAAHVGAGNDAPGRQCAMLGSALSPAQFAVIYTPDDAAAVNTATAIGQVCASTALSG